MGKDGKRKKGMAPLLIMMAIPSEKNVEIKAHDS